MFFKRLISLSNLTLLVALSLSTVAAYYSIIGLTAIFAGAIIPIIVMGSILEIGKITATVWLRKYWNRCSWVLKVYLVPAVVLLALLTSMGIFGFLSKAHMDQGIVSGDSQAKLALYDEKIKTQKDNIETARKALQQMDAQVDQMLGRTDNEKGAERAVQIRRQQAKERTLLQNDIANAQKEISKLNEERAPIAAENRKVEAEVGPIKYIAALIYGDNPDSNLLESAVRWVIILLVIVFDPLAIALVLAANASKEWDDEDFGNSESNKDIDLVTEESIKETNNKQKIGWMFNDPGEHPDDKLEYDNVVEEKIEEKDTTQKVDPLAYLKVPFVHFKNLKPMVMPNTGSAIINDTKDTTEVNEEPKEEVLISDQTLSVDSTTENVSETIEIKEIQTEGVTKENPVQDLNDGYVLYDGKHYSKNALKEIKPDLFIARPDDQNQVKTNFGSDFPKIASKGDIFVRVDTLPNKVYKFDSKRWIEINKTSTDSYLYDIEYVKYLVNKISSGEYDIDLLTENEKAQIEDYLKNQNS